MSKNDSVRVPPEAGFHRRKTAPLDRELLKIFGPPPLFPGESDDDYNCLHDRIRRAVVPSDDMEEFWVHDIVDLSWEILRLRRLKMKLMEVANAKAATAAMFFPEQQRLLGDYAAGRVSARAEVAAMLDRPEIDRGLIEAQALSARLVEFERIEQLIMQAEKRRNVVVREIDRHREAVAKQQMGAIEDLEFEDLSATKAPRL